MHPYNNGQSEAWVFILLNVLMMLSPARANQLLFSVPPGEILERMRMSWFQLIYEAAPYWRRLTRSFLPKSDQSVKTNFAFIVLFVQWNASQFLLQLSLHPTYTYISTISPLFLLAQKHTFCSHIESVTGPYFSPITMNDLPTFSIPISLLLNSNYIALSAHWIRLKIVSGEFQTICTYTSHSRFRFV
jgi:hypothetical protein